MTKPYIFVYIALVIFIGLLNSFLSSLFNWLNMKWRNDGMRQTMSGAQCILQLKLNITNWCCCWVSLGGRIKAVYTLKLLLPFSAGTVLPSAKGKVQATGIYKVRILNEISLNPFFSRQRMRQFSLLGSLFCVCCRPQYLWLHQKTTKPMVFKLNYELRTSLYAGGTILSLRMNHSCFTRYVAVNNNVVRHCTSVERVRCEQT